MPIIFERKNGMAAGEGTPPGKRREACLCVLENRPYRCCQDREGRQLFCLQKTLDLPTDLTQFRVPLNPAQIAQGPAITGDQATNWNSQVYTNRGLLLDGEASQRLFGIKGFIRMAWLQGEPDLVQSRRFLGTVKQKPWHEILHNTELDEEIQATDAWGSQVWFDLHPRIPQPGESHQELVINVRNRTLDSQGTTLADHVERVLRKHCQEFVQIKSLQRLRIPFSDPPAQNEVVAQFVEITVPFSLGPFVIGMNFDHRGEQGLDAPANCFPRNRVSPRKAAGRELAPKFVLPALRSPQQPALPISSVRGPLREAMRWTGWLNDLDVDDASDDLCGWVNAQGQRASRLSLSFSQSHSALVLQPDQFQSRWFYFTNDLLKPMTVPDDARKAFNPLQIVYYPGLQDTLVLRIRHATAQDLWLVKHALQLLHRGFFRIGRFRSRGFGGLQLAPATVVRVHDLRSWLLAPEPPADSFTTETWDWPLTPVCAAEPAAAPEPTLSLEPASPAPVVAAAPVKPSIPGEPFSWASLNDATRSTALATHEPRLDDETVLYCAQQINGNETSGWAILKIEGQLRKQEGWNWKKPNDLTVSPNQWFLGKVNGKISQGARQLTKKGINPV